MSTRLALASLSLLVISLPSVRADTCYYFGRPYECDRGGLSTGARWGIGAGIAVGVIVLVMFFSWWRRKRIMSAWKKHTQNNNQEGLPYHNNDTNTGYYNNTQYPSSYGNNEQYAAPPGAPPIKQPQTAYTPSMAGAYGSNGGTYSYGQNQAQNNDAGPDYEYRQAEENRLAEEAEARRAAGNVSGEPAPPGYDMAVQPTGNGVQGAGSYQPPTGPPPGKGQRQASGGIV